ncbi:Alpha/beta hydrolase fold-1 [Kockovaella imperatae]|uniref:Alpha/beta hydrolase fold-1 n=1 Tax=Kockovaella imperatae TaxID=4999 RepID=A0A1Y1UD83_9TREE|nr:Alpha/beta hydrolase fold-1 [Kockovaella imperatae]ORX35486.1 Alpha/beta hydrolase fold-1 [Kockovaella imperatae]
MASSKPVFFLIQGAWIGSEVFSPVIHLLWSKGYATWCQELPHHNRDPAVTASTTAEFIRAELLKLIDNGHDVIPVCWSLGGKLAPPAFEGLWKKERESFGKSNGIVGMVFASCPLMEKVGMTSRDSQMVNDPKMMFDGADPHETFEYQDGLMTPKLGPDTPFAKSMYASLEGIYPKAHELFDPTIRPLSLATQNEPLNYVPVVKKDPESMEEPGTFHVPVAYFVTEQDRVVSKVIQEKYVNRWKDQWTQVYRFDTGHMLWVAAPEQVVDSLVDFASRV